MAFTILSASGSNLTDLTNLSTDVSLPVNYSLDTSKKFVICNHPEALKNNMYGDKDKTDCNKCLNQVTVPAGTHQIFFSYQYNNGIKNIEISLSHCKEYAVANVVAIWGEN